jgi:hypothetical protein
METYQGTSRIARQSAASALDMKAMPAENFFQAPPGHISQLANPGIDVVFMIDQIADKGDSGLHAGRVSGKSAALEFYPAV